MKMYNLLTTALLIGSSLQAMDLKNTDAKVSAQETRATVARRALLAPFKIYGGLLFKLGSHAIEVGTVYACLNTTWQIAHAVTNQSMEDTAKGVVTAAVLSPLIIGGILTTGTIAHKCNSVGTSLTNNGLNDIKRTFSARSSNRGLQDALDKKS
ncbi:MAG: hypothetical protein WC707_05600 [Candidatus Babeliaceae bacterium]|jgi:hypothetical protein